MESVGVLVVAAASGGALGVARMEVARLVQGALTRLARRGRVGRELALVADALARSDAELAEEMKRLPLPAAQLAAQQLDEALEYEGSDQAERRVTGALREQAETVRGLLTEVLSVSGNHGQVIRASGQATVHAPFKVRGDYIAGQPHPGQTT